MSLRLQCSSLAGVLAPVNLQRRGCRSTGGCWPAISPHLPLFITLSRYLPSSPAIAHSLPYSPVLAGTSPQSSAGSVSLLTLSDHRAIFPPRGVVLKTASSINFLL